MKLMKQLWELYLDWKIRRLAVKLMLSGRVIEAEFLLRELTLVYHSPLPADKQK